MVGAATVQQQYFDVPEDSSEASPHATVRPEERIVEPGKTCPRFVYPWSRQEGATSLGWFIYGEEYADPGSCVLRIFEFDEATGLTGDRGLVVITPLASGPSISIEHLELGRHASVMQRRKNEAAIRLLDEWLADQSGYDEETWPAVKEGIEAARPSYRRRFRD